MRNMPFVAFEHNRVWLALTLIAQGILRRGALLCLEAVERSLVAFLAGLAFSLLAIATLLVELI